MFISVECLFSMTMQQGLAAGGQPAGRQSEGRRGAHRRGAGVAQRTRRNII